MFIPPVEFKDLLSLCHSALQLLWRLVGAEHFSLFFTSIFHSSVHPRSILTSVLFFQFRCELHLDLDCGLPIPRHNTQGRKKFWHWLNTYTRACTTVINYTNTEPKGKWRRRLIALSLSSLTTVCNLKPTIYLKSEFSPEFPLRVTQQVSALFLI